MQNNDKSQIQFVRVLPANIQAEQILIGAILVNPELINQIIDFLKFEHFFEPIHKKIYHAIELLLEKGFTPTTTTLKDIIDHDSLFDQSGNSDYLNKLITLSVVIINIKEYAQIIYDLFIKRELIKIGENIVNTAYDTSILNSYDSQIEHAENQLYNLATLGIGEKTFVNLSYSITESLSNISAAMKSTDHVIGITTGLIDLDTKLSGFHNSDLIILAGRPSMGKTAFAINFALSACMNMQEKNTPPKSVGIFSLEMSSEQLIHRILSMKTHIDLSNLRSGKINEEHYNKLNTAASDLMKLQLFIDDTPALSISSLRIRARKLKRKHNLGILFIDYLQLIRGSNNYDNRVLEISDITRSLKAIAKELNIPVIALSQLSRAVEQRDDKRPMLSDLRESGSIEQDADLVIFLYREEYYLSRKEPQPGDDRHLEWQNKLEQVHNVTDLIIAKHRNGPTGTVQVYYDTRYSKIDNFKKPYY